MRNSIFSIILRKKFKIASHKIGSIHRYNNSVLPRQALLTIFKSFVRSHLDYGDMIYDLSNNANVCEKIESVQFKAALAINGAIKGTSRKKLYKELGLESLTFRMGYRKLCTLFKT